MAAVSEAGHARITPRVSLRQYSANKLEKAGTNATLLTASFFS